MNITDLFELYNKYGKYDYIGEKVSQVDHMIQAAMLAENDNQNLNVVLACFLHDIGHLIGIDKQLESDEFGTFNHESVGATYLKNLGFLYPIPELVVNHVSAKRYLTYKYPEYYAKLSNASKNTLKQQGGPMSFEEANEFENNPLFEVSLKMRKFDELAKVENMEIKSKSYYFNLIKKYMEQNNIE